MIYDSFFQKIACGLLICKNDPYSTIIEANDAFYTMVGYTKEEMLHIYKNRFSELVLDDLTEILEKVADAVAEQRVLNYEYRIKHKSGKTLWIHDLANYDPENDVFFVAIMDITYKAKALEDASHAASIDKLTGLLNRDTLEKRITRTIKEKVAPLSQTMVLIDLDNFKLVNDTRGHQVGDYVLSYIGERLRIHFAETYIVGRLGGDEFMMFLTGAHSPAEIQADIQKLLKVVILNIDNIYVSASVGIVFDCFGNLNFDQLYTAADKALYKSKSLTKGNYQLEIID